MDDDIRRREREARRRTWMRDERDLWTMRGPSRRLRKLYREVDRLEAAIAAAWRTKYVPDHGPSDYVERRAVLRPLWQARDLVVERIAALQNDDARW